MKARAVSAFTADLFEPGPASPGAEVPAGPAPLPAVTPRPVTPRPVTPRPHPRQLWHAAVFPELPESDAARLLQQLSLTAQQFTPLVSIDMPNALLLEIKGSISLFGSLPVLHAALDAAWSRLGWQPRGATAPTSLAALWLARAGQGAAIEDPAKLAGGLAELPIHCTGWDAERLRTLRALGVTRLGELLRLPRAGIARRFGPAAVFDLDVALGRQAAPRRAFIPRERFRERCDFETEVESVVYLQKALEPVIERCAGFLRSRQAGVQALELRLRHRAAPVTRVRFGLASITSERRRLAGVLHEKLHRLELPAPVRGLELVSAWLQPLSADSLDAFAGLRAGSRDTVPQLVERLRARLGEQSVYGLASMAEHRPEAASRRVLALPLSSASHAGGQRVGGAPPMPRPVWLLDEPVLLAADLKRVLDQGLRLQEGPERIESGWWHGTDVVRDYYRACGLKGENWWVFQERRTRCWYLHGVFA